MNFERGKDPIDALEIGLRNEAKVIYSLYLEEKYFDEGSPKTGAIHLEKDSIPGVLESLKDDPIKVLDLTFDELHSYGLIGGSHPLVYEMGSYVKFRDKYYHIPVPPWEHLQGKLLEHHGINEGGNTNPEAVQGRGFRQRLKKMRDLWKARR